MEQTVKKKIGVRDIMTIAAMMVINFAVSYTHLDVYKRQRQRRGGSSYLLYVR